LKLNNLARRKAGYFCSPLPPNERSALVHDSDATMSEYQYYEFQAIDRRLTATEMATLRSFSTRARITPTSFVNDYEWGSFKGDENAWMEKYFDAFLYFANWGSHTLELAIPSRLLDRKSARRYCRGESASVRERNGKTILTFIAQDDEPDDEWDDQTDALPVLIPIRTQLAQGDLRSLYIGWLRCVQAGELDEGDTEPPVPPGLGKLDGSLERLVDFLRVDADLLETAAAASAAMSVTPLSRKAIRQWLSERPLAEKNDYLERFIAAEEPALAAELQRLIARPGMALSNIPPRTVGSLLDAADKAGDQRRRDAAVRAEIEKRRREEKEALARSQHLRELAQQEPAVWKEIRALVATKKPASYDRAVELLVDLRDVSATQSRESNFRTQLDAICAEHARKASFISKLRRAGLPPMTDTIDPLPSAWNRGGTGEIDEQNRLPVRSADADRNDPFVRDSRRSAVPA
jgi:hypothetical protein